MMTIECSGYHKLNQNILEKSLRTILPDSQLLIKYVEISIVERYTKYKKTPVILIQLNYHFSRFQLHQI